MPGQHGDSTADALNETLDGSPYLVPGDERGSAKAGYLHLLLAGVQDRMREVLARISDPPELLRRSYGARLVYESNQLEGLGPSSLDETQRMMTEHAKRDALTRYGLSQLMASEPRLREVLGLNDAYDLAGDLVRSRERGITETDIRDMHRLITAGEPHAGRYKQVENEISGSAHQTTREVDIPAAMHEFVGWMNAHDEPAALVACVVHAWLTYLHPFEDGNGRLARVLANLILYRDGWPPLIIRGSSDRGEYLEALEYSDVGGDILPLFEVFAKALDRSAFEMAQPEFALELLQLDLNLTVDAEYDAWLLLATDFLNRLRTRLRRYGFWVDVVGSLRPSDYRLLRERDRRGNGWFAKIRKLEPEVDLLVWFGHSSPSMRDHLAEIDGIASPSFFFSRRDRDPDAIHPYRSFGGDTSMFRVSEVALHPRRAQAVLRAGTFVDTYEFDDAVKILTRAVCHFEDETARPSSAAP